MLAHDPASLSEKFREGNCFRVWGYQLTGSYAAVPANGPAANESQPHPLSGLRCSAANRGPKNKTPPKRGFAGAGFIKIIAALDDVHGQGGEA